MRIQRVKQVAVALMVTLAAVASPAYADHPDYSGLACGGDLNAVGEAIDRAQFVGRTATTSQSNLLAKLANAATKISQKKYPDAIDKLEDISNTATALADAQKPKLEDATAINEATTAAILCVGAQPLP
jgi:hypothetical protein